jgi:hypothetical protein
MPSSAAQLVALFEQSGYIRKQDRAQVEALGYTDYKKGSEVRLVVASQAELRRAQDLVAAVGLKAGKPFAKHSRYVLPLYGADAVKWFQKHARP